MSPRAVVFAYHDVGVRCLRTLLAHGVEVAAVGGDLSVLDWDPFERAALAAVDETKDAGAVGDATWSVLAQRLDSADLVELVMLVGHYVLLSTVLRSLRLPVEPSAAALAEGVAGGPPA